jgi:hypothetical protein
MRASGATQEVSVELIPEFENRSGRKVVTTTWTGGANIKKRIAAGQIFDRVIVEARRLTALFSRANCLGSRVDLMKSGRRGRPR